MTISNNSIRIDSLLKPLTLLMAVTLAGCSWTGSMRTPDRIDYKSASKKESAAPTLDVPPDLSQISRDNRYSIPGATGGTLTASGFNSRKSELSTQSDAALVPAATVAVNVLQDMRIERDGAQRWLLVPQTPEVLWPKIKQFWQENGFLIAEETESTGIMETDWAENRAKIPEDFIRRTIGYVFDSLYSTGERDRYRTRLERRGDGSTEIYISHRGVEEAYVGAQNEIATWVARPNDPALEAAFLTRLMVRLGTTPEKAKDISSAPLVQTARAQLVKNGASSEVNIDESFDRAWRRIGLALDRVGFTVEDRDRNTGIYFVRYVDADAVSEKGFFSKIFSSDKQSEAKRYRIIVKSDANVSHVTVQNNDGKADVSATSEKILNLLLEQLK